MNFRFVAFVLSRLCFAYVAVLLIPACAAALVDKPNIMTFVMSMLPPLLIGGFLRWYGQTRQGHLNVKDAVLIVAVGWVGICVFGMLPYAFGMPELNWVTCLFESTSMWTTTGVTTLPCFWGMPPSFMVWRTVGHWCGAIGVILLFLFLFPKMSSGSEFILNAELPGRGLERTMPRIKQSAAVVIGIFVMLNVLETGMLMLGGMDIWEALNIAMATAATAGISFFHDGVIVFRDTYTQCVCLIFMFLGGINFTLWFKVLRLDWQGIKEDAEHRYYVLWIVIGTLLLAFGLWRVHYYDFADSLKYGVMMSLSYISTTGFAFDNINNWPEFCQVVFIILMFTGGCSASAAGGLKIIRCTIVMKAFWCELKRILHPNIVYSVNYGGKALHPATVRAVVKFFFFYFVVFVALALAASFNGLGLKEAFTMVASCMSSAGCSLGTVGQGSSYSDIGTLPRLIASLAMLLGRMEFTTLLAVLHPNFWQEK